MIYRLYKQTIGRIPLVHSALRRLTWTAGGVAVAGISRLTGFEFPQDGLFPFFKLPVLLGYYERGCEKVFRQVITPGMIVVDAGAHAGYHTLLFSKLVGAKGRVVAVEPDPHTFAVLERNVARRKVTNVVLVQKAVQDRDAPATLYVTPSSYGNTIFPVKEYQDALTVPGSTIESMARDLGLPHVDFVKLDVEGAELEALQGVGSFARPGTSALLEFKRYIVQGKGLSPEQFLQQLLGMGYQASIIGESGVLSPLLAGGGLDGVESCNLLATRS